VTGMVGRRYRWRGQLVTVIIQWRTGHGPGGPRNVAIRTDTGDHFVVHSRALRALKK